MIVVVREVVDIGPAVVQEGTRTCCWDGGWEQPGAGVFQAQQQGEKTPSLAVGNPPPTVFSFLQLNHGFSHFF